MSTALTTSRIDLRLRMLSDWHIGSGTATHGHVDRRILRDGAGLPFVPAKTLIGVWRDACEVAATALDSGSAGLWHTWVEYLFGSQPAYSVKEEKQTPDPSTALPRPAALQLHGPLGFPGRLGAVLAGRPRLREAVTFVKPGVAIDPRTGTAAEDKLRFDEMARGGLVLTGSAELAGLEALDPEQRGCALGLLWAGASLLEGIGGKRRRGAGHCRLELSGPGWPDTDELLEALGRAAAQPPPEAVAEPDPGPRTAPGDGWERAALTLVLGTPLLAHDRTVGNLVVGRDHAPGWMLLPAVLSRLGSAAAAAARCGDLVVTAATPGADGLPGRPVPRVLAHAKGDPGKVVNRMTEDVDGAVERFRSGYITVDPGGTPSVHRPESVLRMHNTIEDTQQRPTGDLGGVYVYQAIPAGTVLVSEIRVRSGVLEEDWHEKLTGTWRLGRSRKDDYGLVHVTAVPVTETEEESAPLREGDLLKVWLLSDTLVLNPRLSPSTSPTDLARYLQKAFAAAGAAEVRLEPESSSGTRVANAYEASRTDSWHTGWRLPRPTLIGFAAGSCLTFRLTEGQITSDVLAAAERAGVGLRRGEGFGQVRFNDPLLAGQVSLRPGEGRIEREPVTLLTSGEEGRREARLIERAAWRAEIRRAAERLAADRESAVLRGLEDLSTTRLNGLRALLNRPDEGSFGRLVERWELPVGTVDALRDLLFSADRIWQVLDLPAAALRLTETAEPELRAELRPEAVRTLLTACLSARTRREANGEGTERP